MNNPFTFLSSSEAETDRLGNSLAGALQNGLTIALNGQLGSGKTRFVRALCAGLGIDTIAVNSPTFVILQQYTDGRIPVAHMDTYRLADVDEFLSIGADEYLDSEEWLCLIEWADRVEEVLPSDRLDISILQVSPSTRQFSFTSSGARSDAVLSALKVQPEGHKSA